jgi:hypothetical protein
LFPAPAPEHKADAVNHAPDLSPAPESQKDSPEPEDKSSEIIDASSIVQAI